MKSAIFTLYFNGLAVCVQLCIVISMVPLCVWALEALPSFACGRSVTPLRALYGQCGRVLWQGIRSGFWPREGLAFSLVLAVFCAFPAFSVVDQGAEESIFPLLGDPLLIGCALLFGSACLMPVVMIGRYLGAVAVLCMTEMVLVIAAPGVNGLSGVHTALRLTPGSGLAGTSICCALALVVSAPLPTQSELTRLFEDAATPKRRTQRDQHRVLMGFFHVGWLLLVADLLLPVLMGGHGVFGVLSLVGRLVITLGIAVLIKLIGVERYPRLIALLVGLSFLIALAGRFAT